MKKYQFYLNLLEYYWFSDSWPDILARLAIVYYKNSFGMYDLAISTLNIIYTNIYLNKWIVLWIFDALS